MVCFAVILHTYFGRNKFEKNMAAAVIHLEVTDYVIFVAFQGNVQWATQID